MCMQQICLWGSSSCLHVNVQLDAMTAYITSKLLDNKACAGRHRPLLYRAEFLIARDKRIHRERTSRKNTVRLCVQCRADAK